MNETYSLYTKGIVTIVKAVFALFRIVHSALNTEAEFARGVPVIVVEFPEDGTKLRPSGREPANVRLSVNDIAFDNVNPANRVPTVRY